MKMKNCPKNWYVCIFKHIFCYLVYWHCHTFSLSWASPLSLSHMILTCFFQVTNAIKIQSYIKDSFTVLISHFVSIIQTMYKRCSTTLEVPSRSLECYPIDVALCRNLCGTLIQFPIRLVIHFPFMRTICYLFVMLLRLQYAH